MAFHQRCCPVQCIVPPHVLDAIARNGGERERDHALRTLAKDQSVRALRVHRQRLPQEAPSDQLAAPQPHPGTPQRVIFDALGKESAPADRQARRREGDGPTGDAAVNEAFDGFGATYDLYWNAYQRDSIDDRGMPLEGWVHYGRDYDNAFWDGARMLFGDGDGRLFVRFTRSLDVIGHELTHGVTQHEAGLDYFNQPGALNESISDVFGSLVRQHARGQTADEADWLVGADVLGPDVQGVAIRSLKAPGTAYDDPVLGRDPQPASFRDYVHTVDDHGGVHINSGIPNHAFYLLATALGGNAWERAGRIWYEALRDPKLSASATFAQFAVTTVRAAQTLLGPDSTEAEAVRACWAGVDVELPAGGG